LQSDPCACEGGAGADGFDGSAVARAEAAELLETVEAAFDEVALLVQGVILCAWLFVVAPRAWMVATISVES